MKTTIYILSLFFFPIICQQLIADDPYPINSTLVKIEEDVYDCPFGYSYITLDEDHGYSPEEYSFITKLLLSLEFQLTNSETEEPFIPSTYFPCFGIGAYDIARISGGGSQDGVGYNCANRNFDSRNLGDAICTQYIWQDVRKYKVGICPEGTTLVSLAEVTGNIGKYCDMLDDLETVIIGNGATLSGKAYDCQVDRGYVPIFSPMLCGNSTLNDLKAVPANEGACGKEKNLATVVEINDHLDHFCGLLKVGQGARLSGGATLRKSEYECVVFENDKRPVSLAFCGPQGRSFDF